MFAKNNKLNVMCFFDSSCFSVFMISVFPLFGILAEKMGFLITCGIIGTLYIPVMLFLLLRINKHRNIEQEKQKNIKLIGGIKNDRISFK